MISGTEDNDVRELTHEPRFEQGSVDGEIVLFIHGFMGTPRQFDNLVDAVRLQGYSCASLLLPGHGGSVKEFSKTKYTSWQEHVDSEVKRLSETYSKIWIVGHSMGGLLALNASIKFPEHICGIFPIACPLKIVYVSAHAFRINFKKFFRKKSNPIRVAYIKFSSIPRNFSLLWYIHKPDFEFLKLQSKTRKILPQIKSPIVAVFSIKDEVTSIKSLDVMRSELKNCDFKAVMLQESLHAHYPKHEQATVERALLEFIGATV